MVGSADYWEKDIDGNVNVVLNKRLPGSSFKPIDYAAAFRWKTLPPRAFSSTLKPTLAMAGSQRISMEPFVVQFRFETHSEIL